jgi:repressor LexA
VQTEEAHGVYIPVPSEWARNGRFFAVTVSGDSMKDAGVLDGDIVIARAKSVASDGDIVVATFHGETTLKRLKKRGSRWLLIPENRRYRMISIPADTPIVQGIMVGLLRGIPPKNRGLAFQSETKQFKGVQK